MCCTINSGLFLDWSSFLLLLYVWDVLGINYLFISTNECTAINIKQYSYDLKISQLIFGAKDFSIIKVDWYYPNEFQSSD